MKKTDVIIIGAGIVGLAICRELLIRGYKNVSIIDKYGFYIPNHPHLTSSEIILISDINRLIIQNII